ncbi:MAG: cyclic nucleotide-binding domain-containing protein [Desulforhopalus sp.]
MAIPPTPPGNPAVKNSERSIRDLCDKIKIVAEAGDFETAEKLREKLIETAPLATGEAIKSAELIKKEMSAAIDKEHLEIWSDLYKSLTLEERNTLFHSLKKYVVKPKKMLLKQGTLNNRLFFIEKGIVNIRLPAEPGKVKVLTQLGRGNILGEYSFAIIALCSATAVTGTNVEMRCLESKSTEKWHDNYPELYKKIMNYCYQHGSMEQIKARTEQEDRRYPRYAVKGHVKAVLLDRSGEETKISFTGELENISRSGVSFSIQSNKKTTVKQFLTQSFSLAVTCGKQGHELNFTLIGRVVHISPMAYNNYILRFSFDTTLPAELETRLGL